MKELIDRPITCEEYIERHKGFINYCEAIILPNGLIVDGLPSHQEMLIKLSDKAKIELQSIIPSSAAITEWLIGFTGCIAIWYDFIIFDRFTEEQLKTLRTLKSNSVISLYSRPIHTCEYEHCNIWENVNKGNMTIEQFQEEMELYRDSYKQIEY